jgi:ApaG protein
MVGSYEMVNQDGDEFSIDVPAFSLDLPDQGKIVN